jgi:hypothetical protein
MYAKKIKSTYTVYEHADNNGSGSGGVFRKSAFRDAELRRTRSRERNKMAEICVLRRSGHRGLAFSQPFSRDLDPVFLIPRESGMIATPK